VNRRLLVVFLFVIAALLGALFLIVGVPLRTAREEWRSGNHGHAAETLQRWQRLRLRGPEYREMLAIVRLSQGHREEGRELLRGRDGERDWFPLVSKDEVGKRFIAEGRFEEFLIYDEKVEHWRTSDDVWLYRAAAQAGLGRIDMARQALGEIDRDDVETAQHDALQRAIEDRSRGEFPLVVDGEGQTIASYHMRNRDVVAVNSDFFSLVDREAGTFNVESVMDRVGTSGPIELTVDSSIQKAALFALGGFRGSMVVIDVEKNEVLAVANNRADGPPANMALAGFYEPGSIIKVLTGIASYDAGIVDQFFPLDCGGFIEVDGRMFYDWAKHDRLPRIDDAMATSCNVAFALLGQRLGAQKVTELLTRAGFGGRADLGIFDVPLGSISTIGNNYSIANASVGLEQERINAIHVAMLAAAVARGGEMTTPTLVRSRRTILGEKKPFPFRSGKWTIGSPAATQRIRAAMEEVVRSPRGTGRRAAVPGVTLAMKTGTAGTRVPAYNSLVLGYAPSDKPRIAIGMIAEHSGPAELAGAKIVHDFLVQVADEITAPAPKK
jgi:peptidoglycan glycosyltransferase